MIGIIGIFAYGAPPLIVELTLLMMIAGLAVWGYFCGLIPMRIIGLHVLFLPFIILILLYPGAFPSILTALSILTFYTVSVIVGYAFSILTRKSRLNNDTKWFSQAEDKKCPRCGESMVLGKLTGDAIFTKQAALAWIDERGWREREHLDSFWKPQGVKTYRCKRCGVTMPFEGGVSHE